MSTLARFDIASVPRTLVFDPPLSDQEFEALCLLNEDVSFERRKDGVLVMNPPTGGFTGDANAEINYQLRNWWRSNGRQGRVFDSSTGFILPDTSAPSADASFVSPGQLAGLSEKDLIGIPHLCPAFVIELLSHSDRLAEAEKKMQSWIANGAELGWLVDPYRKMVIVFKPSRDPHTVDGGMYHQVAGGGPVEGFTLDLDDVWKCFQL